MNNLIEQQSQRVQRFTQSLGERIDTLPVVSPLIQVARAFDEDRCSLFAAALSYYGLLSIFPLMLFLVALSSLFIPPNIAIRSISSFIGGNLPVSASVLQNNLQQVESLRGPVSILGIAAFLWSASGVFDLIQTGVNRAFRVLRPRPVWRQRIFSFLMIGGVGVLLALSLLVTASIRFAIQNHLLQRHDVLIGVLTTLSAVILSVVVFGLLYRYVPYHSAIRWRHVWLSAVVSAALWEIAKQLFAWYLTNLAPLNLVYGSVGTIIAIMLWGYITGVIMLLGAEITAVRMGLRQHEFTGKEWWGTVAP